MHIKNERSRRFWFDTFVKISDESINENLKKRFKNGIIYTYIGHVLISVNPFRDLGIYTDSVLESYKGKK